MDSHYSASSSGATRSKPLSLQMGKPRDNFVKVGKSDHDAVHALVFSIHQNNLEDLEQLVAERSTPGKPLYQQWLSFDEVGDIITNVDGAKSVLSWLTKNDISVVWVSKRSEYIKAEAKIYLWESLLGADFYEFEDRRVDTFVTSTNPARKLHRTENYVLPEHIVPHLTAVFHTTQIPPELNKKHKQRDADLVAGEGVVDVPFLQSLYEIPTSNYSDNTMQRQAVFETDNAYYSPSDLMQFQLAYNLSLQDAVHPYGFNTNACLHHDCYEGNLDVQYIMGVAQQTETIYWYTADTATGDPFVDWITAVANTTHPPLSTSISWGTPEQALTADIMDAFNVEAMKLALMGVTVVVAAGDNGAADGAQHCTVASGSSHSSWQGSSTWTGEGYFPSFPATSPYVTAVGATMGPEAGNPEVACQSQLGGVITSGGGFSTYYPTPSWQTDAVSKYMTTLSADLIPTSGYNAHGRAYPDVSLIGVKYQTMINGVLEPLYGTSAAAPVFAAMISLLNAERAAHNKTSVGFLNPTLYALGLPNGYGVDAPYNDVTSGDNKCTVYSGADPSDAICCNSGFYATDGWDPVTGWGSVSYTSLQRMFAVTLNATGTTTTAHHSTSSTPSQWALVGIFASGVIFAGLSYWYITRRYCKTASNEPVPADVELATGTDYQQIEPVVIQPDEECVAVEVELV